MPRWEMGVNGKRVAILVAAAMGLVACGGGSDGGGDSAGVIDVDAVLAQDRRIVGAAEQLAEDFASLSPDQAPASFTWAIERGYDLEQLVDAADAGTLALDGFVVADSTVLGSELRMTPGGAEVIEPSGERQGVIAMPDEPQGFRRTLDQPVPVSDFLQVLREDVQSGGLEVEEFSGSAGDEDLNVAVSLIIAIARLVASGYSLEQIVEAVILDTAKLGVEIFDRGDDGKVDCSVLKDPVTGTIVPPGSNDLVWKCSQFVGGRADTASTTVEGDSGDPAVAEPAPAGDTGSGEGIQDGSYTGTMRVRADGANNEDAAFVEEYFSTLGTTNDAQLEVEDGQVTEFRAILSVRFEIGIAGESCIENTTFAFTSDPSSASYTESTATLAVTALFTDTGTCESEENEGADELAYSQSMKFSFDGSTATGEFSSSDDGYAFSFVFDLARS